MPTVPARAIVKPELARDGRRVDVEVHDDFHVVADEADRCDDDGFDAFGLRFAQRVANVGSEPLLAAVRRVVALVDEPPARKLERIADEPAARGELRFVVAAARHRERQAVRREQHERVRALALPAASRAPRARGRSWLR